MKLSTFLFLLPLFTYSQKFDGYVVTNVNDTIHCKFFISTNEFDNSILNVFTIKDKVKILKDNGETVKYTSRDLKSFLVKGTKFGDLKFVSLKYDDNDRFYHEVLVGKLTFYRFYKGPPTIGICFASKDDKFVELQGSQYRERLGELIIDYPELYHKWIDSKKYYKGSQLEEVIKLYNEHFKN
jgi:hypothetical protein